MAGTGVFFAYMNRIEAVRQGTRMSGPSSRNAAPLTLNQAALPRRVKQLLTGVMEYSSQEMERVIAGALNEFEQQLFKHAEQARNLTVQSRWLEAQRQVKRSRADIIPRFLISLENGLAGLRERHGEKVSTGSGSLGSISLSGLSLVDASEMDESTVLMEIASRAELRCSLPLYLLGQRFGVLAASPAFDAEHLPLGPHAITRMVAEASISFELGIEHRVLFYRVFDRHFAPMFEHFVEALNAYLAKGGVLPTLQYVPTRARKIDQNAKVEKTTENSSNARHAKASGDPNEVTPSFMLGGSETNSSKPTTGGASAGETQGYRPFASSGGPGYQTSLPSDLSAEQQASGSNANETDLFSLMRGLMAGRRQLLGKLGQSTASPSARPIAPQDLQQSLRGLQAEPVRPINVQGKPTTRSIGHLKQELLMKLRERDPENPPGLSEVDNDTIDLLGMLFDHIMKDVKPNSPAANLLAKLQVPLMRIALNDKGFFTQQQHPARNMLNTVAEAGAYWLADDDYDPTLLSKLTTVVDRAVRDFDDDPALFGHLHEDIHQHLQTLNRKAEVAERRYVEAARGKEKLTVARDRASEVMEGLLKSHSLPRFTHTLMSQAWTDVLALTLLRQGEDSDAWKQHLGTAERLIDISKGGADVPTQEIDRLKHEVGDALSQVGYQGDEAEAIAGRLVIPNSGTEGDAASRTELTMRMKNRARLGQDVKAQRESVEKLSTEEKARYEQIKTLPFGTWFEFLTNQQGDVVRRRMSWFSPVTGNALFVNARGQKIGDYTLDHLARLMHKGQLRVVEDSQGNMIDRAWGAVVNALRSFVGREEAVAR